MNYSYRLREMLQGWSDLDTSSLFLSKEEIAIKQLQLEVEKIGTMSEEDVKVFLLEKVLPLLIDGVEE